jgi:glucosamine-6-phosphate deaminase
MHNVHILNTSTEAGTEAAMDATETLKQLLSKKQTVNIVLATGMSQVDMLNDLSASREIEWSRVRMFHLDEYAGLSESHPASFRKYLKEKFIQKVSPPLQEVNLIRGDAPEPYAECQRLNEKIRSFNIDLKLLGLGENGHVAFNDPPADFETTEPYIMVELDNVCRNQQLREGWFPDFDSVPKKAITMSVHQIMKAEHIICTVPGKQKAEAVRNCLEKEVSNQYPGSILQKHPNCRYYLDKDSASLLTGKL